MTEFQHLYILKQKAAEHITKKKFPHAIIYINDTLKEFDKAIENIDEEDQMFKIIEDIKLPCHKNLALCYLKQGNFTECIVQCNEVLSIKPNEVKILFRIGTAYMNLGQFEESEKNLRRAYLLNPNEKEIMQALEKLQCLRNSASINNKLAPNEKSYNLVSIVKVIFLWPFLILVYLLRSIFRNEKAKSL